MLKTENISINFGGLKALDNVSISIKNESITALIGPNGAGKTTLFNIITGFLKPTSGKIIFENQNITNFSPNKIFKLGIVRTFQNLKIIKEVTVKENLILGLLKKELKYNYLKNFLRLDKDYRKFIDEKLDEALEFFDIADWKNKTPEESPYGVLKLLELARGYLAKPKLLLLDEPAAGLNNFEKEKMVEIIKRLNEEGVTILMVEHDMNFISSLATHVYCLNFGKIIAEGDFKSVRNNPEVLKAYLGEEDA
ncbi:branched-chain amino acid ABC transporter, ATP-binding protein [Deferribacter desulfuricans SSM1]|uniref:Branched-chain amino acid ABC transporter, ATP-binding protein n=1 Tax=Deferribacter desulfuricans (strain DSM 14783 / JCM 11476 / NBRC 101012 / SSM1) TaxID=639282 RepID=D3PCV8_DEFDS|nr:ABC transporter ATP-binding protein [Deferribacter desulfuricans]BAI80431.1 branched-chain amino acid ABC transporter, ATP-binding protein [Deferribacter desulfuricans SSM1]